MAAESLADWNRSGWRAAPPFRLRRAKGMNSQLQIQLIDGGRIALLRACAPFEPQMNSGDFRQATGDVSQVSGLTGDLI